MKIICPRCGEVKRYSQISYKRSVRVLCEQNDGVYLEDFSERYLDPRCVICGEIVHFEMLKEQEGEG